MDYLVLILSMLMSVGKALSCKKIGVVSSDFKSLMTTNSGVFLVAALCVFASLIGDLNSILNISRYSLLLSLVFAGVMVFTQATQSVAMAKGSSSSTVLIYSCGFLIPVVWSSFIYSEPISIAQYIGMAILLASLYLIVSPDKQSGFSPIWFVFAILAMTGSGITAIIQKVHQHSEFKHELKVFLMYTFIFCSAFSYILSKITRSKNNTSIKVGKRLTISVVSGLFVGLLNIFNLMLAGKIPAVILFPVYNVGGMIITGVAGAIIFKEKNTKKQIIGFIIGCVAIAVIGLL